MRRSALSVLEIDAHRTSTRQYGPGRDPSEQDTR